MVISTVNVLYFIVFGVYNSVYVQGISLSSPSLPQENYYGYEYDYDYDYDNNYILNRLTIVSDLKEGSFNFRKDGLISASAQFSEDQFTNHIYQNKNETITVVDMRKDLHGYIDGHPFSWYGMNNTYTELYTPEEIESLFHKLRDTIIFPVNVCNKVNKGCKDLEGKRVETEEEMIKRNGGKYVRFYVTDHSAPSEDELNNIVNWVKQNGHKRIHVHCRGGKGRTTSFLFIHSVLFRGFSKEEALEYARQFSNYELEISEQDKDMWKYQRFKQRYDRLMSI